MNDELIMQTNNVGDTVIEMSGASYLGIGPQGPQGIQGIPGQAGRDGTNGRDGTDGAPGQDGITPTIGDNGNWYLGSTDTGKPSRGEQGQQGIQGVPGTPGTDGQDGQDGADGKSAYESAQDGGYTGTEQQFNTDLAQVGNKVDKVTGKGLSTNDYTTAEKDKLAGLTQVTIDSTLTHSGQAADAKATGDRLPLIVEFGATAVYDAVNAAWTAGVPIFVRRGTNLYTAADKASAGTFRFVCATSNSSRLLSVILKSDNTWTSSTENLQQTTSSELVTTDTTIVGAINEVANSKVDKAQGTSHAGEFLVVGSDGEVTTQAFSVLTGGSY